MASTPEDKVKAAKEKLRRRTKKRIEILARLAAAQERYQRRADTKASAVDWQPRPSSQEKIELEKADLQTERNKAELRDYSQDIKLRRKYARRIFFMLCWWLGAMLALLVLDGLSLELQGYKILIGFDLADSVLIAAITGTTVNVIGIFHFVAKYLFSREVPKKARSS